MDERFRGKQVWAIAGVLGVIFLCLALCGMGAMATMFLRSSASAVPVPQIPAPQGEGIAAPPQIHYGFGDGGRFGGTSFFGLISSGLGLLFQLLFFGLILLLGFALVRRLLWGPRWARHHGWGSHRGWRHGPHKHGYRPPGGEGGEGKAGQGTWPHPWGPWAAQWCGQPWDEGTEPGGEEGELDDEPSYEDAD